MQSTAQDLGLKPRLAVQGDDSPLRHRPFERPEFLDDTDPVVGDVTQSGKLGAHNNQHDQGDNPKHTRRHIRQRGP
jgi:hypothetical protein